MSKVSQETLHLRMLQLVARQRRGRGLYVIVGAETRSQRELVQAGHLIQEITTGTAGRFYKFTLSASGQRMLDRAEAAQ